MRQAARTARQRRQTLAGCATDTPRRKPDPILLWTTVAGAAAVALLLAVSVWLTHHPEIRTPGCAVARDYDCYRHRHS